MKMKHFIGIDVSKETLDITWLGQDGKQIGYKKIKNARKEIVALSKELKKSCGIEFETTVFCMEYTGVYNLPLLDYFSDNKANIWMESGRQIKLSMGAVRGKDDKVDSARIAMYAFTNRHQIKLWKAPREVIVRLKDLVTYRALLAKQKKGLGVAFKERAAFKPKAHTMPIKASASKLVKGLDNEIKSIEKQITALIKGDEKLSRLYKLVTSVKGVGFVTAVHVIVTTNEFVSITDPKKFGCFCGVVPFKHRSGTSVRGKDRVSHMANKPLKTLLHLCATSAIQAKGELRDYYHRKLEEGKNKMLVINAVRNKIVLRIFACVKDNRMYQKNYSTSLV